MINLYNVTNNLFSNSLDFNETNIFPHSATSLCLSTLAMSIPLMTCTYFKSTKRFFKSVEEGSIRLVKIFLFFGKNINSRDQNGNTALTYSIKNIQISMAKYLIDQGLDINARNINLQTPLMLAVKKRKIKLTNLLLENPTLQVNLQDYKRSTALHYAVIKDDEVTTTLLLQKGRADPNIPEMNGAPPLFAASNKITKILLQYRANINQINQARETALHTAVRSGGINYGLNKMKALFTSPNLDLNIQNIYGDTAIHLTSRFGYLEMYQELSNSRGLRHDLRPRCNSSNLILYAVDGLDTYRYPEMLYYLINHSSYEFIDLFRCIKFLIDKKHGLISDLRTIEKIVTIIRLKSPLSFISREENFQQAHLNPNKYKVYGFSDRNRKEELAVTIEEIFRHQEKCFNMLEKGARDNFNCKLPFDAMCLITKFFVPEIVLSSSAIKTIGSSPTYTWLRFKKNFTSRI